jgi:flagellar biogenesis protein FliO
MAENVFRLIVALIAAIAFIVVHWLVKLAGLIP